MLKYNYFQSAAFLAFCVSTTAGAQEAPQILADKNVAQQNYLPDFSYAGYEFGLAPVPNVEQVINVADFGAVPDDETDDSAALKAAIAAASEKNGAVRVQMAAGRYILSEILWIERSDIVLSGMGNGDGGTQLYMPRPLNQIDDGGALKEVREYLVELDKREKQPEANLDVIFSEYSWSAGFIWARTPGGRHATYLERYDRPITKIADIAGGKRGTKALRMESVKGLAKGDVLQIHWHNRAGPDGALVKSLYGNTKEKIGDRHWTIEDRPLVRQATRIEAINGNQIIIADPLLHDIDSSLPAYFAEWDHLKNVGLQDFAMIFPENPYFGHHNESGFNGVYFTGVHNGWINNLTISNADSGIITDDLANVTISNIITKGDHPAHYSVHVGNVHNVLIDNVQVYNPTRHTFTFNTQATKSVYKNSTAWTTPSLDQHAGANHQNLYDNITIHLSAEGKTEDGTPMFDLYKAGGAGYWKPGHGQFNTQWNINILVDGGVEPGKEIVIQGTGQGPGARIIGMHGNRPIRLDYRPDPYVEWLNKPVNSVPSLHTYQLEQRKKAAKTKP
ncbi:glycosyl hydrolase family 28-related protein [Sphingorhabdus arenilitoris]|uniref:Glycosyl hydrolase family 28-related protein n=1 Tax=Sphingorhabdus arenilitoris TaxID=1490041 RepID=A0ABV8RIV8_9SPHN